MTKKQHYMTWEERQKLEAYYNTVRMPVAKIAKVMGFCRQTIYNEIALGTYMHTVEYRDVKRYSADKAQQLHEAAQSKKGREEKIGNDRQYAEFLEKKIVDDKFSPAAALAEARKKKFSTSVCVTTLYRYIDSGMFARITNENLWQKKARKTRKKQIRRIAHPALPSISERPEKINQREEYGHWEMDLVVGKKGTAPALLTLTERKYREERIFLIPNKQAESVRRIFDALEKKGELAIFKTLTTDNGSEFMEHEKLRKSVKKGTRFDIYYCHSFASWEKGSNENHNRMIRRFFPKGTDFSKVTEEDVKRVEDWMNHYPRKILGWLTPAEAAAGAPRG